LIDKLAINGSTVSVEILDSATRHGLCKEDILIALERSIYDETLESHPNKTLAIGYDRKARLIEVIFHVLSDEHIIVFHSMPCRKHYIERMVK
jgi:sulfur transfer complex TusBCD TusB component (DsrH family)